MKEFSVLSYNIHKGFSLFQRKYTLLKIKNLLDEVDADIVFLQEIRGLCPRGEYSNQFELLADSVWPHTAYGKNAIFTSAHHGNAILSRFPIEHYENKNVSLNGLEKRGILYARIRMDSATPPIHVFCLHLNLLEKDRMKQVDELLLFIADKVPPGEPLLVGGDFNDWTGNISQKISKVLDPLTDETQDLKTYPSFFPLFSLDRMFGNGLILVNIKKLDDKSWLSLSDHLPVLMRVRIK